MSGERVCSVQGEESRGIKRDRRCFVCVLTQLFRCEARAKDGHYGNAGILFMHNTLLLFQKAFPLFCQLLQ